MSAYVMFAEDVLITTGAHTYESKDIPIRSQKTISKDVHIKRGCWIGTKVTILSGVTIGEGSIIGAGAVVTKDIPPYSIAAGVPAKVIKKRFKK